MQRAVADESVSCLREELLARLAVLEARLPPASSPPAHRLQDIFGAAGDVAVLTDVRPCTKVVPFPWNPAAAEFVPGTASTLELQALLEQKSLECEDLRSRWLSAVWELSSARAAVHSNSLRSDADLAPALGAGDGSAEAFGAAAEGVAEEDGGVVASEVASDAGVDPVAAEDPDWDDTPDDGFRSTPWGEPDPDGRGNCVSPACSGLALSAEEAREQLGRAILVALKCSSAIAEAGVNNGEVRLLIDRAIKLKGERFWDARTYLAMFEKLSAVNELILSKLESGMG